MNKRERNMLLITLAIVVPVLAYAFLVPAEHAATESGESAAITSGDAGNARKEFASMSKMIKERSTIEGEYNSISFRAPDITPGRTVGETFQIEVSRMLTQIFKIENPNVSPPRPTLIEGVDDYCLVAVTISIAGTLQETISLLRSLDQRGLLIKSYTLSRPGGWRSSNAISMEVEVSRLVQPDVQTRALLFGNE